MSSRDLEDGMALRLDFTKLRKVVDCGEDLIPAVAQDVDSGNVLIVGYVNERALETARECGLVTFWSSSRNELWIKGRSSGDSLKIVEIRVNCEQNSILYLARPQGRGACHTTDSNGNPRPGCYYRRLTEEGTLEFVDPALK